VSGVINMNKKISKVISVLIMFSVFFSASCKEKKVILLPPEPYDIFIKDTTEKMCNKMLYCYKKMYRTVSPERQKEISVENCRNGALKDLDLKISLHDQKMKILSVMCYDSVINTECDQMAVTALWNPACVQLRDMSNAIRNAATDERIR
jgi:hypothetical protein